MSDKITFRVNGVERTVTADPQLRLLDVIREQLQLTGTKRGCDNGTCGACVVVVDGKARKSCRLKLEQVAGAEILTVEGLSQNGELHPIQTALIEAGAVQCGFCTPGIIMELYALFTADLEASEGKIINALNKHLCRCTGYEAILEGALLAQKRLQSKV
ncbi:MAG TPA: (2Fe-2S)-binding protein [Thermoflexia bacterium]|nr:(2Fe-2S)-binding protein [Thermoflexia bacterium]